MKIPQFCVASGLFISISCAAPLKTAVVTTVVNDVKLSERSGAAKAIGTGQTMGGSSTLLTGRKSRAALTFPDKTVTRIGANSVFRFSSGSRDMEISQGSFLLQVPKGAGGATIGEDRHQQLTLDPLTARAGSPPGGARLGAVFG